MIILALRTDKPEAELYLLEDYEVIAADKWLAHRQLAGALHERIESLLKTKNLDWQAIEGIVVYRGPGSFTGLRIGSSVINALAVSLTIPVIGTNQAEWIKEGINKLLEGDGARYVTPEYGSEAHTTKPSK